MTPDDAAEERLSSLDQMTADLAQRIGKVQRYVQEGDVSHALFLLDASRFDTAEVLRALVLELRRRGWTWQRIGDVVGMTLQAAQQKWGGRPDEG